MGIIKNLKEMMPNLHLEEKYQLAHPQAVRHSAITN